MASCQKMDVKYLIFFLAFAVAYHPVNAKEPFTWTSCGGSSDPIKIGDLNVYQNDSHYLYATGNFKVAFDMSSPIQGKVEMKKSVFGLWVTIPCLDGVGSCTYNDVCALSPYKNECPKKYTDRKLPCRCPILQGKYAFDSFPINIDEIPKWVEEGMFSVKMTLNQGGKRLICLKMTIDLK